MADKNMVGPGRLLNATKGAVPGMVKAVGRPNRRTNRKFSSGSRIKLAQAGKHTQENAFAMKWRRKGNRGGSRKA